MPRYIVLDLYEQATGRGPQVHFKTKSEVAGLTTHIPASAPIALPHLAEIECFFKSEKHFPLLDQNFDPQNAEAEK